MSTKYVDIDDNSSDTPPVSTCPPPTGRRGDWRPRSSRRRRQLSWCGRDDRRLADPDIDDRAGIIRRERDPTIARGRSLGGPWAGIGKTSAPGSRHAGPSSGARQMRALSSKRLGDDRGSGQPRSSPIRESASIAPDGARDPSASRRTIGATGSHRADAAPGLNPLRLR